MTFPVRNLDPKYRIRFGFRTKLFWFFSVPEGAESKSDSLISAASYFPHHCQFRTYSCTNKCEESTWRILRSRLESKHFGSKLKWGPFISLPWSNPFCNTEHETRHYLKILFFVRFPFLNTYQRSKFYQTLCNSSVYLQPTHESVYRFELSEFTLGVRVYNAPYLTPCWSLHPFGKLWDLGIDGEKVHASRS